MVVPLPPEVHGPITRFSPSVRVTGIVAGATVEVMEDGAVIADHFSTGNGEVWVGVSVSSVGAAITARQSTEEGTSESSASIPVIDIPTPLPLPVFVSPLSTGMSTVRLAGLVPGSEVELRNNGALVGRGTAQDTTAWIWIDPNANLDGGTPIQARQEIGGVASDWVDSLPMVTLGQETPLPAPGIGQPVTACETSINVSGATPSADLTVDNEGHETTWYSPASAYGAWGASPFKPGTILARQAFPRLGLESLETTVPVGPPSTPPAPTIQSDICPKVAKIKVSNLSAGGLLTVYSRSPDPGNPATIVETAIGVAGITNAVETFNLPTGFAAGGALALVATQTRCDLVSTKSAPARFEAPGGPHMIPIVAGPLYACARVIVMQSAHIGALVEARSASTGLPLGDPFLVGAPTVFYKPWIPLVEGDEVFIRQFGCNADGDSEAPSTVHPLDDPFPMPEIGTPVRPAAPAVYAKGFLRGARAHLLVNGAVRTSIDTQYSDAWIPSGVPALAEHDQLTVVQTLCQQTSNIEQRPVIVTRGRLNVTVSPAAPVIRGTTAQLTVTAADKDTGAAVPGAQVRLNGIIVGSTGTAFAFSPPLGLAAANGIVRSPLQYHDAAFAVALSNPPPTVARVHLNVGPVVPIPNTLVMKSATWTVTPQWGASQAFTVNGANITLTLPKPSGGSGNLVITLATTWEVAGHVLGSEFEHAIFNGMMFPAPTTVVWDGSERTIGFWALPEVSDAGDGTPWLNVVAYYQGLQ
jgi:hypothetical protein